MGNINIGILNQIKKPRIYGVLTYNPGTFDNQLIHFLNKTMCKYSSYWLEFIKLSITVCCKTTCVRSNNTKTTQIIAIILKTGRTCLNMTDLYRQLSVL